MDPEKAPVSAASTTKLGGDTPANTKPDSANSRSNRPHELKPSRHHIEHAEEKVDPEKEKELRHHEHVLKWKLDLIILPMTFGMYLLAYLARGNLGNARLQGLQDQVLENNDNYFNISLSAFYITYIIFNIPGTILPQFIDPTHALALALLIWGAAATCSAAVNNIAGLIVCRLFLGIGEAGFTAAVGLYYAMWYKREEIAVRLAIFIGSGALAGTFGGLIAYGVGKIDSPSIDAWRVLFLIEGLPAVFLSVVVYFFLPGRPETSKLLNEAERKIAVSRINKNSGVKEGPKNFSVKGFKRAFHDWKNYTVSGMYLGVNLTLGSISGFLPTIIKTLGYDDVEAQLVTVPPYAVALVWMSIVCYLSDRMRIRGLFVFVNGMIATVGFILLLSVYNNNSVRYFAVFLIVAPTFSNVPLCMSWLSNNNALESSRAVALGLNNSIGQFFSILASFSFPGNEGPKYIRGMALNLTFSIVTAALGILLYTYLKYENHRRNVLEGHPPNNLSGLEIADKFDKAPYFRYIC